MTIIVEVAKELLTMFLADAWLTTATLALVAFVASLIVFMNAPPLLGGGLLLLGSVAILLRASFRGARSQKHS